MSRWRPQPGDLYPTLGRLVIPWIETYLAAPDRTDGSLLVLTPEQCTFLMRLYRVDPETGRRRDVRRAVYSRPKGAGKSPLLAAIGAVEALGPVVPDGFDANGQPVGKEWLTVRTPWVQFFAVAEDQTKNSWIPLLEMLREGPACDDFPGLEPMETFVNLPVKGRIEFATSAGSSKEGNRPVAAILDQTEAWNASNGGVKLAATVRRNIGKTDGCSIESPNAYEPGAGSVAEDTAEYAKKISEGRAKAEGLLYDHREAPPETDMSDAESLRAGLLVAYGDSAEDNGGWVNLERLMAEIWDPATAPQDARRFYLNQITHASDSWISQPEWAGRVDVRTVADREAVTLGFDGSRHRSHGVTDATALIGCRVSDGHLFEIGVWEQPDNMTDWQVPALEVDAAVHTAFAKYNVVGFFADPAKWESYIAGWEAKYHKRLQIKSTRDHPIEWWMTGGRSLQTVRALEQFHSAVIDGELTHDGTSILTRHVLNARRRPTRSGIQIAKEHPDSARKIDAAVAAVLAWQARLDAVAAGIGAPTFIPRRIR